MRASLNHSLHHAIIGTRIVQIIGLSSLLASLIITPIQALAVDAADVIIDDKSLIEENLMPEYQWEENKRPLPPKPNDKDLIEVELDGAPRGYSYYLDGAHLTISGDELVRYTLVRENIDKQRQTSFNAIHCSTGETKRYGYINTEGEIRRDKRPKWRYVRDKRYPEAATSLIRDYFCSEFHTTLKRDDIQQRLDGGFTASLTDTE